MFEAFITNLGRYNEGYLDGEYLKLPATTEQVQALLKRIHVDGVQYEEIFITDYDIEIPGLYDRLGEYESIDELNYLAALLEEMDEGDLEKFAAAVEYGEYTGSVKDFINLTQNLDCYDYFPGVDDNEDLGYYLVDEMGMLDIPEHIQPYFDYEAYGRDISIEDGGTFTESGYIIMGGGWIEHYSGRDDIPDEHRIFAYPEREKSILVAMKNYPQMISEKPTAAQERSRPANAEL
jgi:antirestriction protein